MIGLTISCFIDSIFKREERLLAERKMLAHTKDKFEKEMRQQKGRNEVSTAWYYLDKEAEKIKKKISCINERLHEIEYRQRTLRGLIESEEIKVKIYQEQK